MGDSHAESSKAQEDTTVKGKDSQDQEAKLRGVPNGSKDGADSLNGGNEGESTDTPREAGTASQEPVQDATSSRNGGEKTVAAAAAKGQDGTDIAESLDLRPSKIDETIFIPLHCDKLEIHPAEDGKSASAELPAPDQSLDQTGDLPNNSTKAEEKDDAHVCANVDIQPTNTSEEPQEVRSRIFGIPWTPIQQMALKIF